MPTADARVTTDRAERYLDQLCSHLGAMEHMRHLPASGHGGAGAPRVEHVEKSATRAVIRFTEGSWILEALSDALILRVEAADTAALERLKSAITTRIAKIGRRDALTVEWHQSSSTQESPDRAPAIAGADTDQDPDPRTSQRRWWPRAGWLAAIGLAVALHLGLIGPLLGSGRWKDVAADAILALLGIKLLLIAVHVRFRRNASGRG